MPSFYSYLGLTRHSWDLWRNGGPSARSVQDRLHFYLSYLQEVAPHEISVTFLPIHQQPYHLNPEVDGIEIRLMYRHMIFMTGFVSLQYGSPEAVEEIAARVAYSEYCSNEFVPNGRNWRIFTCTTRLRFCTVRGNHFDRTPGFHPITQAAEVAEYLQQEFDRVMPYASLEPPR